MLLRFSIIPAIYLAIATAHAAPISPANYPYDLKYKDDIIDPTCFTDARMTIENFTDGYIELNKCSPRPPVLDKSETDSLTDFTKQNYTGYQEPVEPGSEINSYKYYRAFKAGLGKYFIESVFSGGGTGVFTGLELITRIDKYTFKTDGIAGGDRCNGGVTVDENYKGPGLKYRKHLTPADLVMFSTAYKEGEKIFDNLDFCAACCIASDVHVLDNNGKDTAHYIEIEQNSFYAEEITEAPENDAHLHQRHLQKLLYSNIKNGKTRFSESEIDNIIREYVKQAQRGT